MTTNNNKLDFLDEIIDLSSISLESVGNEDKSFIVMEDLDKLIPLPTDEEIENLEASIREHGVRDPLDVWIRPDGVRVLLDGHNRWRIIQKLDLKSWDVRFHHYQDIEEAKVWMISNQLGRRNVSDAQKSYLRGSLYNKEKQEKGGFDKVKKGKDGSKGHSDLLMDEWQKEPGSTAQRIAEQSQVSEKTVKRDGLYQKGLDLLDEFSIETNWKTKVLNGVYKIPKKEVIDYAMGKTEVVFDRNKLWLVSFVPKETKKPEKSNPFLAKFEKQKEVIISEIKALEVDKTSMIDQAKINEMFIILSEYSGKYLTHQEKQNS